MTLVDQKCVSASEVPNTRYGEGRCELLVHRTNSHFAFQDEQVNYIDSIFWILMLRVSARSSQAQMTRRGIELKLVKQIKSA